MHFKNGREAKNGDKVVMFSQDGAVRRVGILYNATPGNNACNGNLAEMRPTDHYANLSECLHIDDVNAAVKADANCAAPSKA